MSTPVKDIYTCKCEGGHSVSHCQLQCWCTYLNVTVSGTAGTTEDRKLESLLFRGLASIPLNAYDLKSTRDMGVGVGN